MANNNKLKEKLKYTYIWWLLLSLQYIGLMVEVLFKGLNTFWLVFGAIILVYGMYMPLQDKDVYNQITSRN